MKTYTLALTASALVSGASAFCPPQHQAASSSLAASNGKWGPAVAATVVGWTIAAQVAGAAVAPQLPSSFASSSSIVSVKEKAADPTYEKLDFSMPSYNSASVSGGFGQGTEARLGAADNAEADKQKVAMQKAEAARQERLKQQKEETKAREADVKARELVKKAERERRMKGIFD